MTSELDELAAIRQLMGDAQRTVQDDGSHFVTWGLLTAAGLLVTYAALLLHWPPIVVSITWPVLIAIGWVAAGIQARRGHVRASVRSLADRLLRDLWIGVGTTLAILPFAGRATGTIPAAALPGVMSAVVGIGVFASAPLHPVLPLRWLGALWWTGAIVMLLRPGPYTLLLMTVMVLGLEVVPGLMLRRAYRNPAPDGA